ncbi:MAG: UDP-N-acetylmuramate--L-alanine ligase [Cytophagales bacterium]|nr:UDP-N-acetylmuramate--L-alanine ligase [Cytophagales bacterium]
MKHAIRHIHFIGIGGTGMCGIAEVLLNQGYVISGSDMGQNAATARLASLGAVVAKGHAAGNIAGADCIVTSTAVQADNVEVVAARAKHIPIVPRAVMLAELMRMKQGIAVAGTHGKTTTTSLIASILAEAGFDPTYVIGGRLNSAGTNAKLGSGDYIVVEADESDASFLNLLPTLAVVTNIDADHMETYGHDLGKLHQAFIDFLHKMPFYGAAILCSDDAGVQAIIDRVARPITTYGLNADAHVRAVQVRADNGQMHFVCERKNGIQLPDLPITLNTPGQHNVRNALAAIAVAVELNVPDSAIQSALAKFAGVGRRFQRYGDFKTSDGGAATLIDDYGHHPVEMAATLAAARGAFVGRRLVLAFQPHRYTRTRDCFDDFVRVMTQHGADAVLLTEVYAAGEAPIAAADGRALMHGLRTAIQMQAGHNEIVFVPHIADMAGAIRSFAKDGDVVLCMGAGSIGAVCAEVLK